jgi:hypothetical protein
VLNMPTASRAQPAPFRASRLSLSEINKPKPMPRATRVPAINMISGIVKLLSLINNAVLSSVSVAALSLFSRVLFRLIQVLCQFEVLLQHW